MPIPINSDKGKRVLDFLRWELQIPEYATDINVRMSVNGLITVDCEYYPRDDSDHKTGHAADFVPCDVKEDDPVYHEDQRGPSLRDLVDWSQAPEWATRAIQVRREPFSPQDNKHPIYFFSPTLDGRHVFYCFAPLAHDWQAPLRRPKKTCPVCEGKGRWR